MVIAATWALWAAGLAVAGATPAAPAPGADPTAKALARGEYPWYDAKADALRPVTPPVMMPESQVQTRSEFDLGQLIVFLLIAAALAALLVGIAYAYHRHLLRDDMPLGPRRGPALAVARTGPLPAGVETGVTDPLAEAARLRAAGDYAGAVVRLFAHQLLTLDRLHLARLIPGRTGRQLVRSVSDASIRALVEPALRLFEEVYYGHRPPSREAFEAVWDKAQALERRIAEGAGP